MQAADARRAALRSFAAGLGSALTFALSFPLSDTLVAGWPLAFVWPALLALSVRLAPRPATLVWSVGVPYFAAFLAHEWWMRHITELGMPVLVLYLTGWTVLLALSLRRLVMHGDGQSRWPFALALPCILVSIEYLRGSLLCSGYAWFFAAHPLVEWTEVAQIAALGGGWLLTALIAFVAGAGIDAFVQRGRARLALPAVALVLLALSWIYGRSHVHRIDAEAEGAVLARPRLLVVQTNMPMSNKFSSSAEQDIEDFTSFARQTIVGAQAARAQGGGIDVALWPETALPGPGLEPESLRTMVDGGYRPGNLYEQALRDISERIGAPLIVGSPAYVGLTVEADHFRWTHRFNSAYLVGPDGARGRTDKIYLTPFGEVMPIISNWNWLEDQLLALGADGMSFDLDAADSPSVLTIDTAGGQVHLAVPICFEITQPWAARRIAFPNGERAADVLVNLSNDGWFGGSLAGRRQHLQVSQLRAIEMATPVVRCVNTGLSASIDAAGRVESVQQAGTATEFVATPSAGKGRPLAILVGDGVAVAACLAVVFGLARRPKGARGTADLPATVAP